MQKTLMERTLENASLKLEDDRRNLQKPRLKNTFPIMLITDRGVPIAELVALYPGNIVRGTRVKNRWDLR